MVDSSPSPASVPQFDATPAPKAGAASRSHAGSHAHGRAHGSDAIEIFTSFHALVEAITEDKPASAPSKGDAVKGETSAASEQSGVSEKTETPTSIVMPLEIAALLLPHTFGARGLGGNAHAPGATTDGHVLDGADGDLAALLAGVRAAGFIDADTMLGADDQDPDGVARAARFGLPIGPDFAPGGDKSDGDALAQAVIQRLLAAASAGPQRLAAELAGSKGSTTQNVVDDLLRRVGLPADRSASAGVAGASRLVSQHIGQLTASTAPAFAAEVTAATSTLLEPPSTAQLDRIVQAIRLQWSGGGGEARITLEPQHFGELTVSLRVDQGQVVARLQADTPVIREWLQANQQVLRQSLAEHNLTLKLEVSEPGESHKGGTRDSQEQRDAQEGRPGRRPRTPDTGEIFEIVA